MIFIIPFLLFSQNVFARCGEGFHLYCNEDNNCTCESNKPKVEFVLLTAPASGRPEVDFRLTNRSRNVLSCQFNYLAFDVRGNSYLNSLSQSSNPYATSRYKHAVTNFPSSVQIDTGKGLVFLGTSFCQEK
ncbi:MAG: hypothetical protein CL678_12400 [Bdellovibrionaceae bacterium]|nr:hypothetical protein [Pseudobdellovibrionaceae bacterium]